MGTLRKMDTTSGVALVIGSIVGSGIFITPSLIASFSVSLWIIGLLWVVGALVCTAGAIIYGSLGLRFPGGGGQYLFLRETLGRRFAAFYGWSSMLVIGPTMAAGLAIFLATLCEGVLPELVPFSKIMAIGTLLVFTILNNYGLHLSGRVQKSLVVIQITLFFSVIALGFWRLPNQELGGYLSAPWIQEGTSLGRAVLALAAVLWSFEGFNSVTFVTDELEDGARSVRRVALAGCAIVFLLYLLFNGAVLVNIPAAQLVHQTNAASYLMTAALGGGAAWLVFVLTALGVAGVLHSSLIIGPRVIAATLADGEVLRSFAKRDDRTGAPSLALWFQFFASATYVLIGHFESLLTTFIVLNWLFYGLTTIGFLRLCSQKPERRAGDIACGLVFLSMVALLVVSQFLENPMLACAGLGAFVIVGVGAVVRR